MHQDFPQVPLPLGAPLSPGELCVVPDARGLVVFAHADGGEQTGWRSRSVARQLHRRGLSTLLFDLVAPREPDEGKKHHDVPLLAQRLGQALDALPASLREQPLGLLASGSGTAAALVVAADPARQVRAVVSRGGRPDLAVDVLGDVRAPTLLLVGAVDPELLEINQWAAERLSCEKRLTIVPRATRLFLEAGTLDAVSRLSADWFLAHFARPA